MAEQDHSGEKDASGRMTLSQALSEQIMPVKWDVRSKWHDQIGFSDAHIWTVHVEDGGSDYGYAVRSILGCLSHEREWVHEPIPSSRTDEWLAEHRFKSLDTALAYALVAVEHITVNGLTPRRAAEEYARRFRPAGGDS